MFHTSINVFFLFLHVISYNAFILPNVGVLCTARACFPELVFLSVLCSLLDLFVGPLLLV